MTEHESALIIQSDQGEDLCALATYFNPRK
jgi:hypothetical protein